jgi:hypothetical protein
MLLNHQLIGKLKNQVLLNAFKLKQLQTPVNPLVLKTTKNPNLKH